MPNPPIKYPTLTGASITYAVSSHPHVQITLVDDLVTPPTYRFTCGAVSFEATAGEIEGFIDRMQDDANLEWKLVSLYGPKPPPPAKAKVIGQRWELV